MSASDSHHAEVRKYISQYVTNPLPTGIREPSVTEAMRNHEEQKVDAIMALLTIEQERWIGEVRSRLPEGSRGGHQSAEDKGFDRALDAVSKVLEGLK